MARSIAQIQATIVAAIQSNPTLAALNSTSAVAIWRLLTYIVAVCQWTIEQLFDAHVAEVNSIIATQKPHTLQWYVGKALAFEYGYTLPDGDDEYDNSTLTDAQVETAKVVTYAAATENNNIVRIKVATGIPGNLSPLSTPQLSALTAYMRLVRDAGVRISVTSGNADRFFLNAEIYYDALVLDSTGRRLDGTGNTPVQDAIAAYLAALPFNGVFTLNYFVDALQAVRGVKIARPLNCSVSYAFVPPQNITVTYQPDAGYMSIDTADDLTLTFIPH